MNKWVVNFLHWLHKQRHNIRRHCYNIRKLYLFNGFLSTDQSFSFSVCKLNATNLCRNILKNQTIKMKRFWSSVCVPVIKSPYHKFVCLDSKFKKWFIYLFLNLIFIVIQLQLSAFSPHPSTPPQPNPPTSLPRLHPPPWFCPCVLYSSSCKPLSPLSPLHSPLAIVRLFLTSMSLVIFCLLFFFCWLCSS